MKITKNKLDKEMILNTIQFTSIMIALSLIHNSFCEVNWHSFLYGIIACKLFSTFAPKSLITIEFGGEAKNEKSKKTIFKK